MREVANQIGSFVTKEKINEHKADDLVTSADYAAQKMYVKLIDETTPHAGIVAEENGLKREPKAWESLVYTIDPVDGTKALVRTQSDGIGTLLGVVDATKQEIIAAYVGDIMTQELYYYRPDGDSVHRINLRFPEKATDLSYKPKIHKRLLMLDDIRLFPSWADTVTQHGGYFDSIGISNGSIGTNMARLRKGEVDAVLLKWGITYPRDRVPVAGISGRLWFDLIEIKAGKIMDILPIQKTMSLDVQNFWTMLIVHKSTTQALLKALRDVGVDQLQ